MTNYLRVVDGFLPDPMSFREAALRSEIGFHSGPDGAKYRVAGITPDGALEKLGLIVGGKAVSKFSFIRLDLDGEHPYNHCHADKICATHAALLYLNTNDQSFGGTAFFRHRDLGIYEMPDNHEETFANRIDRDSVDPAKWDLVGFIGMRFNRLIVYPTSAFHSRYPHAAFGNGATDGRLVWICFFDIE